MHDPKITIFQTNRLRKFAKDSIMETCIYKRYVRFRKKNQVDILEGE